MTITETFSPTKTLTPSPTGTATQIPVQTPVLYPNPTNGLQPVQIKLPNYPGVGMVTIEVFTTAFRKVNTEGFPNQVGGSSVPLALTGRNGVPLANGVYYVLVQSPAGRSVLKLLILR
jgi:hypothetical protein